jgi:2-dehydropantoate 2-reductase
MRVAVIGAGALGSVFGALLHEAGIDTVLIERDKKCVELVQREGLNLEGVSGDRIVHLNMVQDPARIEKADLALVMVKAYDTEAAIPTIAAAIKDEAAVLTLQNGVGSFEILERAFPSRALLGTTTVGAMTVGANSFRHTGFGDTALGEPEPMVSERADAIARLLNGARLGKAYATDNAMGSVWSKLILNCAINPTGALLRLRNGDIPRSPQGERLMGEIVDECVSVIKRKGIKLLFDEPGKKALEVCASTSGNINSMFQDILAGRRTEVDFINGAIAREGKALGVAVKVNETMALMIKALESTADLRVVHNH